MTQYLLHDIDKRIRPLDLITGILAAIGAINWGLVGAFEFDLIAKIFGDMSALTRIIYVLVGLNGIYLLVWLLGSRASRTDTVR